MSNRVVLFWWPSRPSPRRPPPRADLYLGPGLIGVAFGNSLPQKVSHPILVLDACWPVSTAGWGFEVDTNVRARVLITRARRRQ